MLSDQSFEENPAVSTTAPKQAHKDRTPQEIMFESRRSNFEVDVILLSSERHPVETVSKSEKELVSLNTSD